jgi:hypothetical protein
MGLQWSERSRIARASRNVDEGMHRYRLLDQATGADLGPFVSPRLAFEPGETLSRASGERFELVNVVEPENENFRAYLIVRQLRRAEQAS